MKKSINPQALAIQRRFFEALEMAVSLGAVNGLKGFCESHNLNRTKYSRIKNDLNKPLGEMRYKMIDIDALSGICTDFGVSAEWLLLGRGKMLKRDDN
ncbi:hypothetical protein ACTMKN_10875 [Bacteroides pyogenes]|uniref:Helix-turn-helix transcriptional regulator n=3 Tax=Bacteroides pyogenes TaxID=310300 RepID=A0A5D3EUK1_9BACE|nr:hypothetical protein [Bacteroides pyogenes]GAE14643.1 hypothetical protein JCM6292_806 [Bacteroides pyogenes JCM 6292]MBR8725485.1 hypothetical protein [Bacteroides pyogenes]MBR8737734.1 hypothetical protein [Bacteroides pyogenes]MBR8753220.1 hypothetical protein [Bacteroides pyogenes]MBR8794642.1 hypothetical protein [Bacteroides pyogenes]